MAQTDAGPGTPGPPRSGRGNPTLADIVRSVALLGVVILFLTGIGLFFTQRSDPADRAVDYKTPLAQAATISGYDLLAPGQLPSGWKATSVSFDPGPKGRWHLGVLTDDGDYVGLEQTPIPIRSTLADFAPKTTAKGTVQLADQSWQLRTSSRETSFVRRSEGITVLVTGTAPRKDLERFVESLVVRAAD